ncbi:hypothetical protein CLAFUW4_07958 [Fulvia fulva]|uniref:Uncharacterized protein n=1 Tax=Passalora fulva TaxID=5499 RepID=A0A9Q8LCK3_PASFU|nr:uncharacterized protein CLAFUR5_08080 [Fulvia fulva]KAK4629325.1 hypothetical protein CLAFUR4_07963 [Fulvia fulva]KAK4630324.1 hypothetical protein CLAFUR0_07960 [Fulvia fulva]UJO14890.1 hypothetical protein CLAFUR5_08080 [Fulvia fulva]WPV12733.1 hypothetical protein CLAFUW4_07958 [Fulvia fulva]WPV27999.1 hypothetical protein CLAFUW7_07959 [Fulvia fulva]
MAAQRALSSRKNFGRVVDLVEPDEILKIWFQVEAHLNNLIILESELGLQFVLVSVIIVVNQSGDVVCLAVNVFK